MNVSMISLANSILPAITKESKNNKDGKKKQEEVKEHLFLEEIQLFLGRRNT